MKMITLIILGLLSLIVATIVSAYTAPDSNNVNLVLDIGYTAPDQHNVNLILADVITDTCSCPSLNENWEIDMSDYCNITTNCDLGTGGLNFTGIGETRCNATINTVDLGDTGSSGILYIQDNCLINIKS